MFKFLTKKLTHWLIADRPPPETRLCDFERIRYELRPCDVMLIEGRSRVADVIMNVTQSPWSHAMIYIGRLHDIEDPNMRAVVQKHFDGPPDTQLMIEGLLGSGIIVNPITLYKDDHIRLCRPRGLSHTDAQKVTSHAIECLGHEYDIRQIIDLYRFLLPWSIFPRTWRSSLFKKLPGKATKTVCSTMIAEAFMSIDFPILPVIRKDVHENLKLRKRNPKLYTPSDFDYSPYFDIIKYPFIDYQHHAMYRHLPWEDNDEMEASHETMKTTPKVIKAPDAEPDEPTQEKEVQDKHEQS